ncbi:hypothetical protein HPB47_004338 [Ixodes persulcatus]|uniref:Uncharacterized protein n=1 Tax=Ixodes persulcatus TaxID=34615 RepID=A0AC60PG47_IXOPE|nr:hypothetical protein HPB47_004338 [Ixodes persulcatus]
MNSRLLREGRGNLQVGCTVLYIPTENPKVESLSQLKLTDYLNNIAPGMGNPMPAQRHANNDDPCRGHRVPAAPADLRAQGDRERSHRRTLRADATPCARRGFEVPDLTGREPRPGLRRDVLVWVSIRHELERAPVPEIASRQRRGGCLARTA